MIDCGGTDPLVLGISILVYCTDLSGAKEGGFTIFIYLMKCKSKNRIHKHHIY